MLQVSAINLLTSYFKDCTTRVCALGEYSKDHVLQHGVPHGSIADPPIFTAYAQPYTNIIRRFQIRTWMLVNKLKLNDSKTELFLITSPRNASFVSHLEMEIGESVITPSASIKPWYHV